MEEQEAGLRHAQAAEQGGQGGFSATGGPFEPEPVASADPEIAPPQDGRAAVAVAEDDLVRLEHGRVAVGAIGAGRSREGERRGAAHLRAGRCVEERRHLLPGDRGACQMPHPRRQLV
jgi:hypothetical protein